jgi:type VI secretion system protein ImpH
MEAPHRSSPAPVTEAAPTVRALAEASRHGFVALVSLLERLAPGAARPGEDGPMGAEAVRFHHDPRLTFHTGDISLVVPARTSTPDDTSRPGPPTVDVTTTFLGLTGATSPLPAHMAEAVALEDAEHGPQAAFLDVFHHRLLSHLYRLLVKYDHPREYLTGAKDAWSGRMLALAGVPAPEDLETLPRWRLLRLAPLLLTHGRSARTLELALADVLGEALPGATFAVEEFVGAWVPLEAPQRARLGRAHASLGKDFLLGSKLYDRGGKFRIHIGPLRQADAERLRPGGSLHTTVREVVGLVITDPLAYDLELTLDAEATPPWSLSRAVTTRLGRDAWLAGRKKRATTVRFDVEDGVAVRVEPTATMEPI